MSEDSEPKSTAPSQPVANWQYAGPPLSAPADPLATAGNDPDSNAEHSETVTWTAAEFIAHQKNVGWHMIVIFGAGIVSVLLYLLTRDVISAVAIVVVGILFSLASTRKPRTLTYTLDNDGLTIGSRFHPYADFKSFSVLVEGTMASIELIPQKRFMPFFTVYCSPENENQILDKLSDHVPYEERPHALIDVLARLVRF